MILKFQLPPPVEHLLARSHAIFSPALDNVELSPAPQIPSKPYANHEVCHAWEWIVAYTHLI
jgi:hypothetical protein